MTTTQIQGFDKDNKPVGEVFTAIGALAIERHTDRLKHYPDIVVIRTKDFGPAQAWVNTWERFPL